MSTPDPLSAPDQSAHDAWVTLLPWYVNGSLDERDRERVRDHLDACARCQEEVAFLQDLATVAQAHTASDIRPTPHELTPRPLFDRWRWSWHVTPPRMRWLVGAQLAAVAAVMLVVVPLDGFRTTNGLRTAADPATVAASAPRLQLIVRDTTPEARLRALLLAFDLAIVDGPSPLGVYIVEVRSDRIATTVARSLVEHPEVRLASVLP